MTGYSALSHRFRFERAALFVGLVLAAALMPSASAITAAMTLEVEASSGLPGLHRGELQRYLALQMAEAGLGEWRFEPAADRSSARDRVEWTFKLNPYAGGEVRNFKHTPVDRRRFGQHRPITIEARLYLNGEYQTLVEKQAVLQGGGPNDPEFAAAVVGITQNLLGPQGAFHAAESGRRPPYGPR